MIINSDLRPQNQKLLLLFGTGGHGRVVADAALLQGQWDSILASSRNLPMHITQLLPGVNFVDFKEHIYTGAAWHFSIGNNGSRQTEANALGVDRLASVIHPCACVSIFSQIGAGSFVAAGAVIGPLAVVGLGVIVNHCAVIDHDAEVGDFSHISQGASVCGHAKLGQRVLIGIGAVVLSSVVLGDDVTLSSGSVANGNLLAPGVYGGIPAVKID